MQKKTLQSKPKVGTSWGLILNGPKQAQINESHMSCWLSVRVEVTGGVHSIPWWAIWAPKHEWAYSIPNAQLNQDFEDLILI